MPMRRPVNEPGPMPTAIAPTSRNRQSGSPEKFVERAGQCCAVRGRGTLERRGDVAACYQREAGD